MARVDVSFTSGGTRCAAWLFRPDPAEGPVPCVVLAHGFSAVREQRLDAYAERFAAAGLAALVFDYRHFGASEGEPRQLLEIGRQLDDWRAAIAYARGLDGVDPERVALLGSSFSGGHVLALAAEDHRVAAVVAQCPMADGLRSVLMIPPRALPRLVVAGLRDQLRALAGRPPLRIPAAGRPGDLAAMTAPDALPGMQGLTPPESTWRNAVAARIALRLGLYRPGRAAARIVCPLLVCVCEHDSVVSPAAAERAARQAPRGEVRRYPIGHFDVYVGEWFERAVTDQTEFLVRHLAPAATPAPARSPA